MKKVLLSLAVVGFFAFTSCKNEGDKVAVETEVETVDGENVADAQEDLNEDLMSAQNELNEAKAELEEAQASGDATLVDEAQAKIDELQAKVDEIQQSAGDAIQAVDGAADTAEDVLD